MGDRGHNRHGPKRGGLLCPFRWNGTPSNTMLPRPRSTSVPSGVFIHPAVGHNRHGRKLGGSECLFSGVAGSPSNTKSPGSRPIFILSGIIVHPAAWPQRTLAKNWGSVPP